MTDQPLASFVYDAWPAAPAHSAVVSRPAALGVNPPGAVFQPLAPAPVPTPPLGKGRVVAVLGVGRFMARADAAALAFLQSRQAGDGPSLLVDLGADAGTWRHALEGLRQVKGGDIWRTRPLPAGGRLRDRLLFLSTCREKYTTSALAMPAHAALADPVRLLTADRVLVATGADATVQAQQTLAKLREAGVASRECLWLDAA